VRAILGAAVVIGVPVLLFFAVHSAYKASPEPGGVAPSAMDFPKPGAPQRPAQPTKAPVAPPPAPVAKPVAPQPKAVASPAVEMSSKQAAECSDTQDELDQISARLQQPASKAEGDWMRERVRKLQAQLKELKCAH
jgi:hypothetical protein